MTLQNTSKTQGFPVKTLTKPLKNKEKSRFLCKTTVNDKYRTGLCETFV